MPSSTQETSPQGFPFDEVIPTAAEAVQGLSTGSCLQFSNTASWADVAADVSRLSSDAATFEAWINTSVAPDAFSGQVVYIGKDGDGASPRISVDASSRIKVYWSRAGTGGGHGSSDTRPIIDGRWHHVAVVFDRGAITFYKDGQPTTEPAPVSMPGGQPAGSPCQIGAAFGDATGFVGQIFDLRVWNQPRTGEQIRGLMYGAVDGSLAQQLGTFKQQGLLIAANFDSGRAPVNLVSGATGDLNGCTIVQSPLPQNQPTITFGSFASDVHGIWNVMTPKTSARMQSVISDSNEWKKLVEDQMLLNGFFSSLQTSGDEAWGDATDSTGRPYKIAKWQDKNLVTHAIKLTAGFAQKQSSDLQGDPVPTGNGATAHIIADDQGGAALITQRIETVTNWTGTATFLAFLLAKAVSKSLTSDLNTLRSAANEAKALYEQERLADSAYDEAFSAVVKVEGELKAVEAFGKAATFLAVIAALVDGIFRLFHPATMSVSMWNETDLDLEWSLGYLNEGSYWINSDGKPNDSWRPFPKKSTVNDDTTPIFGPIQYETVAAVNLLFANGKPNIPVADQDIDQCLLIRKKGSTGDPYVLLLYTPLVFNNHMGMGTGKGDQAYFTSNVDNTPSDKLDLHYTFQIDGTAVDFHLLTDTLSGQTSYAGFEGYNYNTLLYIKSKPSSQTAV